MGRNEVILAFTIIHITMQFPTGVLKHKFLGQKVFLVYLLGFKIEVACYFAEHAPVNPVRMTYSNGYQNARTGVGSKVLVFIRPCDPLWVHRGVFHKIACDFYFETEQVEFFTPSCILCCVGDGCCGVPYLSRACRYP